MKYSHTFLVFCLLLLYSCKKNGSDTGTDLCPVGDSVRTNYTMSAYQLIMNRYADDHALPGLSSPELPVSETDNILGYLQTVYSLNIKERDSVVLIYFIHPKPLFSLTDLTLSLNAATPEVKQLLSTKHSGNPEFDALLDRFQIDSVRPIIDQYYGATTGKPLNLVEASRELSKFPFVYNSQPAVFGGDGNDLILKKHSGYVELDFSLGWGDCPLGCMYRRHWVFHVANCKATFIRSYGDTI